YFLKRVATSIVEVRDGRVINYRGDYDSYIHMVNREIDEGERENKSVVAKSGGGAKNKNTASQTATSVRNDREIRKEITTVERSISKLDQEKKGLSIQFLAAVDPAESLKLHNEVAALTQTLAALEERWLILQQELGE
ncbi:MAG: ABC transporter ATP-binding protein, partial [Planctomycetota bacterium]